MAVCAFGAGALRVGHADHGQFRLRDDHAQGDLDVDYVHDAFPQAAFAYLFGDRLVVVAQGGLARKGVGGMLRRRWCGQHVVVFCNVQALDEGKAVVGEGELHVLAGAEAGCREHDREVLFNELAQTTEKLLGIAGNVDSLDGQLVVD